MANQRKRSSSGNCHSRQLIKLQISYATFQQWKVQYNAELKMLTWLHCEKDMGNAHVVSLWCEICQSYERKIAAKRI